MTLAVAAGMGVAVVAGTVPHAAVAAPRHATASPFAATRPEAAVASLASLLPTSLTAHPASLTAGPAGAAAEGVKGKRLKAALLAEADLPAGYHQVGKRIVLDGDIFGIKSGGTIPHTGSCSIVLDLDKLLNPATPAPAPPPGRTGIALFSGGDQGPVVAELLGVGDPVAARAFVEAFADAMRRCPTITIGAAGQREKLVITQTELPMPPFGDASVGVMLTVKIESLGAPLTIKMSAVAKGRSACIVLFAGADPNALGGFATIVHAAVHKLGILG